MSEPVLHNARARTLLVKATAKLAQLRLADQWELQLPSRCPPVLWFGNADSAKPKIVMLGANPSRQEYLGDSKKRAIAKVQRTGDDSQLSYLESPANRLRLLERSETLIDIIARTELQDEIIASYNDYFSHKPYYYSCS